MDILERDIQQRLALLQINFSKVFDLAKPFYSYLYEEFKWEEVYRKNYINLATITLQRKDFEVQLRLAPNVCDRFSVCITKGLHREYFLYPQQYKEIVNLVDTYAK